MKIMVGGLDQCDNGGNEEQSNSGYILKVGPIGFAVELAVTNGKPSGVKDDSKLFGQRSMTLSCDQETQC